MCVSAFSGEVVDLHEGTHLTGATILLEGTGRATASDARGQFLLENLCPGRYTVRISHLNCEARVIAIHLKDALFKRIYLEHHVKELEEIIITNEGEDDPFRTETRTHLSREVLERYSSRQMADALAVLPGVSVLRTGHALGKPLIHGVSGSRVAIVVGG